MEQKGAAQPEGLAASAAARISEVTLMYRECPHGIVAGTCMWCMAETLEYESKAVETVRRAVYEREMEEARIRVEREKAKKGGA